MSGLKRRLLQRLSSANKDRVAIVLNAARAFKNSYRNNALLSSAPDVPRASQLAIPIEDIKRTLQKLGIKKSDWICVHASLKAFHRDGRTSSGIISTAEYGNQIIDALQELLGSDGLIMMPTDFSGDYIAASRQKKLLSVKEGVSNRGALTEIFRNRAGTYRSTSPIYTVSVLGHGLEEAAQNHWNLSYAMDTGSPWDVFAKKGGKVIFLGCEFEINSFIHHPEYVLKNEYPLPVFYNRPHNFLMKNVDGETREIESYVHAISWTADTVPKFCNYLNEKYNIYRTEALDNVPITVFKAGDQTNALHEELRNGVRWYDAALW